MRAPLELSGWSHGNTAAVQEFATNIGQCKEGFVRGVPSKWICEAVSSSSRERLGTLTAVMHEFDGFPRTPAERDLARAAAPLDDNLGVHQVAGHPLAGIEGLDGSAQLNLVSHVTRRVTAAAARASQ